MITMIKKTLTLLAFLLAFNATTAWAISLSDAKTQRIVGEQLNGYLGLVNSNASGEVKALVRDINSKRRAAYAEKARKAGVDINVIEIRIGERLQQRATSGQYIQNSNGQWILK
ncbi:MAG: YdbL family protein [Amphritea sp.]